jgi:hypothetical protein
LYDTIDRKPCAKEVRTMERFSHIVLYEVNPRNPNAAQTIVEQANRLLQPIITGSSMFHAALIPPSERAVGCNKFQVALNFIFESRNAYESYMVHLNHLKFVHFVLRGWMIEGSKAEDPEAEFISHILNASPDAEPVRWARNSTISETEVVWAGEAVHDACNR